MSVKPRGFTVSEIIIAFSLLTIAALGLIAALTRIMMAQSSSSHHTVARILADSVLQESVLTDPAPWAPTDGVKTRQVRVGQSAEVVEFYHQRFATRIDPPASFEPTNPEFSQMGLMWEIKVQVWWNGAAYEGGVEKGTQTVEVTSLAYVEE